jgi:hypothetical protein
MTRARPPSLLSLYVTAALATGCLTRASTTIDVDATDGNALDLMPEKDPLRALGASCWSESECASGFCSDGVCCESPCDETCYACNLGGTEGICRGLTGVADPAAAVACDVPHLCATDSAGSATCKLGDGEACLADSDCAGGVCRTYYPDDDCDGYGVVDASRTITQCDHVPRTPPGYSTSAADCCDTDPGAHPGVSAYSAVRTKCGTFDWNCDGANERQGTRTCPTEAGQPVACGQACVLTFKESSTVLYVQACR